MDRGRYKVEYQDLPEEEWREWLADGYGEVKGRLWIDPPLSLVLVQKIKAIERVGFIGNGKDCATLFWVSPHEILLESNCPGIGFCRKHGGKLISKILEILKEGGEVTFSGFL